ncbi:hypothetical protein LEP1GSC188_2997 [Leptospira weilii serovar Topaz str. LT2116]|uniref:Uncharacterized protein n=1 Tax=Leptospira weilii serovar Topaz str. LT2116 TaxID=1088540 RepID=M3ENR9_9LEPT|nr:hypothetical protein LEP1GSC188_2997 [Leptospira weilii serovar Topaz str. LT2116]
MSITYDSFYFSRKRNLIPSFKSLFYVLLLFVFIQCSSSKNSILGTVFVRKGFTPEKKYGT